MENAQVEPKVVNTVPVPAGMYHTGTGRYVPYQYVYRC